MKQGTIHRTLCDRVDARGEARLPTAWVGGEASPGACADGEWLTRTLPPAVPAKETAILAFLGSDSADAIAELLVHAATKARVYLLVGPQWGTDRADAALAQGPRLLVRRVAEVPASAVLNGAEARLWIGGDWSLRLDPAQAQALRQVFLRLFWHEATEEAWSDGRQFAWHAVGERPFDVPAMPAAAAVRWEDPDAHLSGDLGGALLHLSAGLPPEVAPRRLWFPAGPSHHGQLARLAKAGVEVVWADRGLPDLYVSGGEGEVLMPGAQGRLRLRLTPSQSAALGQLLAAAPVWRFRTEARIGDAAYRNARFWLPEEASASGLQAEQLVELADMTASSLRELPTTAPVEVPAAQPLALTVRYQWTVVPPRVPAGAVEDVLVGRWRKLDQDWQARLATVQEALGEAKHERGRMGRALQRLQSALLGFERTHGGLLQRVEALRAQRPSLVGPGGAATLLSQAAEVEDAARKLHGEQDAAERKAREDDERDRQLAAWQRRTEDAKRELPNRRAALKAAEQRRDACAEELRGVDEAMQAADKTAKKNAVASQRKLADDLQRAEKEIAKHRNEIEDLAQQLAGCFEFRPPPAPASRAQQVKGRFVPVASAARSAVDVPDEKLPEVGTLRSHKGRRYLVIDSWDHLAVGEQAAARLAAHLVAPENT